MTSAQLRAYNRSQENIIMGSTSLKIKVELRVNGVRLECGEFENILDLRKWVRGKIKQYDLHTPGAQVELVSI